MEDEVVVTFYFVSGKSIEVLYSKERLDTVIELLKIHWTSSSSTGPLFGINFSLVTHYEVKV